MGLTVEQISRDIFSVPRRAKRFAKRQLARKWRRQARRDPENASRKKRYDGWYW
jgi:hypothetical protein